MTQLEQQTLKYQTIKTFLNATKSMLDQFPSLQTRPLFNRINTLETQLETAYQTNNPKKLHQISQKTDILAIDLLDYLDTLNTLPTPSLEA